MPFSLRRKKTIQIYYYLGHLGSWTSGWKKFFFLFRRHSDIRLEISHINPITPKISLVILLTVCSVILDMLVREFGIESTYNTLRFFSLFSSLICLILYWYCKEKFYLGHSWELRGLHKLLMLDVFIYHDLIHSCIRGKLVEVNEKLVTNPQLLLEKVWH